MVKIMKEKSWNNYKIPHIKENNNAKRRLTLTRLKCDPLLLEEVIDYLIDV